MSSRVSVLVSAYEFIGALCVYVYFLWLWIKMKKKKELMADSESVFYCLSFQCLSSLFYVKTVSWTLALS